MKILIICGVWLAASGLSVGQERRGGVVDVGSYKIDARIDPAEQSLTATAQMTFTPVDDRVMMVSFEFNNALAVSGVTDATGAALATQRTMEGHMLHVNFPQPLAKGTPVTINVSYSGRLTGDEDGPVLGLRFAAITSEHAYLLYPARWFPVSGYTTDRYTMDLNVRVPSGFQVVTSGVEVSGADGPVYKFGTAGFPGSLAVVRGAAQQVRVEGVNTSVWFRGEKQELARPYGEETAKVLGYLTSVFGVPPVRDLMLVETGPGAPGGYAAPGILFVSPGGIGRQPSQRLLANQITRQWFGNLISPVNRNHIWIMNGLAKYMELMYLEHLNGPAVLEPEVKDLYVDSLTVTEAPVRQAARFEDYSPEFFAVTGSKGAATYNMLRWIIGEANFQKMLKAMCDGFAGKAIATDDVRKAAEEASGQVLQGFFIQWLESTGAPEFKMEYTVYRTQKGFRVMGKIQQDLDTFRMPVELRIETEGNPEDKRVDVVGPATDFSVETFGKPRRVAIDPNGRVLRFSPAMRVSVAIRKGEQFAEIGAYNEALKEYQKALEVTRISSLAHYRVAEVFFLQGNYQSAANEFREALNGDGEPKWTDVWSHLSLGKIFDITQQRERAVNEYTLALRTKDNTQGAQEEAAKYLQTPYQRKESN